MDSSKNLTKKPAGSGIRDADKNSPGSEIRDADKNSSRIRIQGVKKHLGSATLLKGYRYKIQAEVEVSLSKVISKFERML
jgi:hypothetical protein